MEISFNSPFKNRQFLNNADKYLNKSAQLNIRKSLLSLNYFNDYSDIYSINKLKNDLRDRRYNINNDNINKNININNGHQKKHYISYINYFFRILKPFSEEINIKKLSYDIPLIIYVVFIFLKFIFSKKINSIHLCLLILLPIFAHILINNYSFSYIFCMVSKIIHPKVFDNHFEKLYLNK